MMKIMQCTWRIPQDSIYREKSIRTLCQHPALPAILWILLFWANLMDYLGTQHALSHSCHELNPLISSLLQVKEFNAFLTMKAFFLAVLLVLLPFIRGKTLALLAIATIVYLMVAAYQICGTYFLEFM